VYCKRLHQLRDVREHLACPYCFGAASDVLSGDRGRFCDFDAALDPVVFGFPRAYGRMSRG
jgi:hypothetical protein